MDINRLINLLKNKKFYVISPHFDDAVLSMGMLLYELKDSANATIINAFTKAENPPYSLSGRKFIYSSGYIDGIKLFQDRAEEDKKAMAIVNAKFINLGLTDALFRKRSYKSYFGKFIPELNHIYPTYRWHLIKKINDYDSATEDLEKKLEQLIPAEAIVFSPMGIGNHADHVIVRKVSEKLFKNLILFSDFPYNLRLNNFGRPENGFVQIEYPVDLTVKTKLIKYYKSQINGLFKGGLVPEHTEKIYISNSFAKNLNF